MVDPNSWSPFSKNVFITYQVNYLEIECFKDERKGNAWSEPSPPSPNFEFSLPLLHSLLFIKVSTTEFSISIIINVII